MTDSPATSGLPDQPPKPPSPAIVQQAMKEKRELTRREIRDSRLIERHYNGPIPPPDMFESYEAILPGSADRLLTLAEKEQAHRHANEDQAQAIARSLQQANITTERVGMGIAFVIVIAFLGAGTVMIASGKEISGLIAMAGALAPLIGSFIVYGSRRQSASKRRRDSQPDRN